MSFYKLNRYMAWLVHAFVILMLCAGPSKAMSQGVRLYEFVPENFARDDSTVAGLKEYRGQKDTTDVALIRIDPTALQSEWISFSLPDGELLQVHRLPDSDVFPRAPGRWYGKISEGGGQDRVSLYGTDRISGYFDYKGRKYDIRRLPGGYQVIMRYLPIDLPRADDGAVEPPEGRDYPKPDGLGASSAVKPVIRILIGYTQKASTWFKGDDPTEVGARAVELMNKAFSDSGVSATMELAGVVLTEVAETGVFLNDLEEARADTVLRQARDKLAADIVIKLVWTKPDAKLCGLAYRNAPAASAYGIVAAESLGKYGDCFAHEAAHIFGTDHDTDNSSTPPPFSYDHGLYYSPTDPNEQGCFKTIMSYDFDGKSGAKKFLNNFSSPFILYRHSTGTTGEFSTGVPTGNAKFADNARVLGENAARVAAFR